MSACGICGASDHDAPAATAAVTLTDGETTGTLIGPADRIGQLVRPEAVVTTAVPDSFRDQLAEALVWAEAAERRPDGVRLDILHRYIDALLPLVEAERRRYAAEQLDLAAVLTVPSEDTAEEVREALLRRADALRAEESA